MKIGNKHYLILANIALVVLLVLLNNLRVIPLRTGDFVFFAILTLAFALYRPGWAFLMFIGTIPLENINLAPDILEIAVRPYQFLGALIILAIIIRLTTKRLNFKLAKLNLADYAVIVMVLAGFVSAVGAKDFLPLKMSIIFATFAALYFLTRNFIQNISDLKKIIPFFLGSSVVVIFYGLWQNIRFLHSLSNFEAMPGRPNGTFTEAEWLGMFIIVVASIIYSLIYFFSKDSSTNKDTQISNFKFLNYFLLTISFVLLVITVSRSAWLGAFASLAIFLWIFFTDLKFKNWRWKETILLKLKIISSLAVAVAVVYVFHLTNFQLENRIQSTGTGLQKITIVCPPHEWVCKIPDVIEDTKELERCECKQINLEDIEKAGGIVSEVYRKDPNIKLRNEIYQKSWAEIKKHPLIGIGWGNISNILGKDGRGTPLNSSNIFLEAWLGAGIAGFLALVFLLGYILYNAIKNYHHAQNTEEKVVNLFIISSWFGIVVFNLFNAGMFLGFLWVWLGITSVNSTEL